MDHDVLTCVGLTRRFGDRVAVDGVNFTVAEGETYGLLGPNGAGKTTTISMVCGLMDADAGEVWVAGRPMSPDALDAKASVGLVPQDVALYPDLTVRENLEFFGRLQGLHGAPLASRVADVLEIIGLDERAGDRVETCSGGMKRRANIGAGLLHEPALLVLDEPTVGVDPQSRNQILESIETLSSTGLSVLYTTHYMEEAERLCDRIGIIDDGRIVAEGTRRELVDVLGRGAQLRLELDTSARAWQERLAGFDGVEAATADGRILTLSVTDPSRSLAEVVRILTGDGVMVTGLEVTEPDLEAVFLELTGKALRD
ncbi:MAG TPA: ABC transporter ATP-binding protein [Microthrixaceae bacterium]|nr:ABC transporter ATP-binding protein [Microthrixaceae bacterium]